MWHMDLVAQQHVESSWTRDRTHVAWVGRWILTYCTTREVPKYFLIIFKNLIYFLVALGLHCCSQAFSSCSELGLLLVAVHGLLIVVASLVVEHRL